MKVKAHIYQICIFLFTIIFISNNSFAQKTKAQKKQDKIAAVKNMVENKNYIFMAQRANPLGWATINLNYDYNVKITKDSIDSYLPYYGRAYVAPMNPTDPKQTGIQFISKNFDYQSSISKNKGWNITIVPHDSREIRSLFFYISESGYATVSVTSTNRQQISFDGYITEIPKKKN